MPGEVAEIEGASRVAIDRAPEEHILALPLFRNEFRMSEKVVQNVGIENGFAFQLLAKLVTTNGLAVFLTFGQVECDLTRVPLHLAALLMFLDRPAIWNVWAGVAVNDVLRREDLRVAPDDVLDLSQLRE